MQSRGSKPFVLTDRSLVSHTTNSGDGLHRVHADMRGISSSRLKRVSTRQRSVLDAAVGTLTSRSSARQGVRGTITTSAGWGPRWRTLEYLYARGAAAVWEREGGAAVTCASTGERCIDMEAPRARTHFLLVQPVVSSASDGPVRLWHTAQSSHKKILKFELRQTEWRSISAHGDMRIPHERRT
jgi:hypothetical protein